MNTINEKVIRRYKKTKTTYTRLFGYFKVTCDCMFSELAYLTNSSHTIRTIIDIGTGYGVPATWLVEKYPEAIVYGIEPDPERVCVASEVLGNQAVIEHGRAPNIPNPPTLADMAILLDMIHYLTDDELKLTLERIHNKLIPASRLLIRTAIPPEKIGSWLWYLENMKLKIRKISYYYRSIDQMRQLLEDTGFKIEQISKSGNKGESYWFIGSRI